MSEAMAEPKRLSAAAAGVQLGADLERLPGVVAAAVWLDDGGGIAQVRVHTQPSASATVLAHTVTRVLEQRGYLLDPAVLRIVQVAALGDPPRAGARYLVLHDLALARQGSRVTCTVQQACQNVIVLGEASELDTEAGRVRAAAVATLRAAEGTREGLALGVEHVAVASLFGRRYVAVSVEAAAPQRRFAQLAGLVLIDPSRSLEEAASMATLRAVERWITL
jgi:hypothetical protein